MDTAAIDTAAAAVKAQFSGVFPATALVLGSGLGAFGDSLDLDAVISYQDIPGFPVSTVVGHAGRLLICKCEGTPVVCMQGRMHAYEGYEPSQLAIPVRTLKRLGVETLILTNAAGSTRPAMGPGSLMVIDDHINFSGRNPLIGPNDESFGPRFPDMTDAYDPALRTKLRKAAVRAGVDIHSGVYVFTAGPNFETPAEIRMFASLGGDAVGMSTVPECLVARHAGMAVAGLSIITNLAAGMSSNPLTHEETVEEGAKAFEDVSGLFRAFFKDLT